MPVDITPIGLAFLLAISLSLIVQPRTLVWVLSAAIPFSYASMITVGSNGLSPFWVTAIAAVARLLFLLLVRFRQSKSLTRMTPRLRGATAAMLAFALYGGLITLIGPLIFAGMPVIAPRGGLDSQIDNLTPLSYSVSNFAQLAYLAIGIGLVLYLIVEPPTSLRPLEAAIVIGFALTLFKHFLPDFWPQAWFDSNPSYSYHWLNSSARERGPFAEPSLLGIFVSMSLAYTVAAIIRASWRMRLYYAILIVIGVYLLGISYTGTGVISTAAVASAALIAWMVLLVKRASARTRSIAISSVAVALILGLLFHDVLKRFTFDLVVQKLGSDSFSNRSASNANSFQVFLNSFGLGVGLGSDRPSSVFFQLLACVGIIGTLLFLRAVSGYTVIGFRRAATRPVAWAFLAQGTAQALATPDLSMPAMWFLLGSLGSSYSAWAIRQAHPSDHGRPLRSLIVWIPREFQLHPVTLPGDLPWSGPDIPARPLRRHSRRDRVHARTGRRSRILGVVAVTAIVAFFAAAGFDGYVAQHQERLAIEKASSKVGKKVEQYAEIWTSVEARKTSGDEDIQTLLSVLKWTTPADIAPASLLEDFTTKVGGYRWAVTNTPAELSPPAAMESLTSVSPPSTRQDTRETERTIAKLQEREGRVAAAIASLTAYRADIDSRRQAVMESFVRLSTGLLAASDELDLDLDDGPPEESTAYASAIEALGQLPAGADLRLRYDQYLKALSARNTLVRAIEAERVEQERREQDRLERERRERDAQSTTPPPTEVTPPPTEPTPAPTEPPPGPGPNPTPSPEPTPPLPTPTFPPDGGESGESPTDSASGFDANARS